MANYQSAYTGQEIDAAIGAVAGKQDLLVSGTNIKTINNTSILGAGNIDIQGGGGDGASMRVVDATNPDDWSGDSPTQACMIDVLTHEYQLIYITNIPSDVPGMEYAIVMYLNAKVDNDTVGEEIHMRQYLRFEGDDEEENSYIQGFTFSKEGSDDAEMSLDEYPLGGGGSGDDAPILFKAFASYISGTTGDTEFTIYDTGLSDISDAIDYYKEVVIRVDGSNYDDNKYFRLSNFDRNGRTYIQDWDKNLYFPDFVCETPYGQCYAKFDHIEAALNYAVYKVVEGTKHYQPTNVNFSTNSITFDSDDQTQIWLQKPADITVNVDENNGTNWVAFEKTAQDDTQGAESVTWTSKVVVDNSHVYVYKLVLAYNQGMTETSIYKYELTVTPV